MEQSQADHHSNQARTKSPWSCLVALVAVAVPYVLISRIISPSDWVDVTVGPLPSGYESFCLVAEDSKGIGTLPWYHSKVFAFTADPFMGGSLGGGFWDADHDGFILASVQWREASRYGVLIHFRDDQWRLVWLASSGVRRPSVSRFVVGGGRAAMTLSSEDLTQVPSRELLERLGLSHEKE